MRMFKILFIFVFLSALVCQGKETLENYPDTKGDNAATSAAPFLKLETSARSVALGSAGISLVTGVDGFKHNAASLGTVENTAFTFSRNEWIAGVTNMYAAFAINLDNYTIGLDYQNFTYGDIEYTTYDKPAGNGKFFEPTALSIGLGSSFKISDTFTFGVKAKYISEQIDLSNATSFAVDVGVIYKSPLKGLTMAVSVENFGTPMQLQGENLRKLVAVGDNSTVKDVPAYYLTDEFNLPLSFKFGLAYFNNINEDFSYTVVSQFYQPYDENMIYNAGVEFGVFDQFFLRLGGIYKPEHIVVQSKLTFGLGAKINVKETNIKLNYAYETHDYLDPIQYIDFIFEL